MKKIARTDRQTWIIEATEEEVNLLEQRRVEELDEVLDDTVWQTHMEDRIAVLKISNSAKRPLLQNCRVVFSGTRYADLRPYRRYFLAPIPEGQKNDLLPFDEWVSQPDIAGRVKSMRGIGPYLSTEILKGLESYRKQRSRLEGLER